MEILFFRNWVLDDDAANMNIIIIITITKRRLLFKYINLFINI
jgi:hypothetical protein